MSRWGVSYHQTLHPVCGHRTHYPFTALSLGSSADRWHHTVLEEVEDELPGVTSDEAGKARALKPCSMSVLVQWSDVEGGDLRRKVELQGLELFQKR